MSFTPLCQTCMQVSWQIYTANGKKTREFLLLFFEGWWHCWESTQTRGTYRKFGHLSKLLNIFHFVCQRCPLSSLLYILTLDSLLQKLETLRCVLCDLVCGNSMSMLMMTPWWCWVTDRSTWLVKKYEMVTRVKINIEKVVGLQIVSWRSKSMLSNSIMGLSGQPVPLNYSGSGSSQTSI